MPFEINSRLNLDELLHKCVHDNTNRIEVIKQLIISLEKIQ